MAITVTIIIILCLGAFMPMFRVFRGEQCMYSTVYMLRVCGMCALCNIDKDCSGVGDN